MIKRDPLAYEGEVSAELQSTVRRGPLVVGFLVSGLVLILSNFALIFVPSNLYLSVVSISALLLYFSLLAATWLKQTKAGPIVAWFKQRTEHVYLRFEDDDFVIRLPGKRESYKPSKLEWINDWTLRIFESPTHLQLAFKTPDDARQIASRISRICELQPKT